MRCQREKEGLSEKIIGCETSIITKRKSLFKIENFIQKMSEEDDKTVLVIDDDIITQNMLRTTLANAGYSVRVASTGEEGIRLAKEKRSSVIILDIMMPDLDGGEVASILKADPGTQDIPIIFLSSLISEKEEKIGSRKDMISFLSKPYNRDKLLNEIRKYLV